ncbi:hypothetical protein RIF23_20585 [Lipingzhangella sp. LS1_29]|uniref:PH (Pleckstrin Homology) domain-containing protein n=1 Tax=Lipingzhangella rawalii TaxID=2055835 RepID=A0ABU2HBJ8_9ACTN|nr:hypothetical protein [Lipingzhangella rawalii]MDS1272683.1 hypothetical protein [Lipingzhangella rawalii]
MPLRARWIWIWIYFTGGAIVNCIYLPFTWLSGTGLGSDTSDFPLGWVLLGNVLFLAWGCYVAPRMLTRQGAAVSATGITLVQEPLLWFPGRGVALAWEQIHAITSAHESDGSGTESTNHRTVVRIRPTDPDQLPKLPSWASRRLLFLNDTVIQVDSWLKHAQRLLQVLRETRPDLVHEH